MKKIIFILFTLLLSSCGPSKSGPATGQVQAQNNSTQTAIIANCSTLNNCQPVNIDTDGTIKFSFKLPSDVDANYDVKFYNFSDVAVQTKATITCSYGYCRESLYDVFFTRVDQESSGKVATVTMQYMGANSYKAVDVDFEVKIIKR